MLYRYFTNVKSIDEVDKCTQNKGFSERESEKSGSAALLAWMVVFMTSGLSIAGRSLRGDIREGMQSAGAGAALIKPASGPGGAGQALDDASCSIVDRKPSLGSV